jgi:hypothetical protein
MTTVDSIVTTITVMRMYVALAPFCAPAIILVGQLFAIQRMIQNNGLHIQGLQYSYGCGVTISLLELILCSS